VTKDQKEEVKISIDISTPEIALPLKDALYMGFEQQQSVPLDEDQKDFVKLY